MPAPAKYNQWRARERFWRVNGSMATFDLVLLATFWYMLKSVPGLMQFVGYFFGFVLASWAFDQYFPRD